MKSFKELIDEAHYVATADYKISASGRKVHKMKKVADDPTDQEDDQEEPKLKEGAVPAHMQGKQKPYVSSDGKGNYEVLGNKGQTKAEFSRKEHGKDAHKKAQDHLKSKYDEYMKEETEQIDEATDKQEQRLLLLARLGLVDKSEVSKLRIALEQFKADKSLTVQQRTMLLGVMEDLISLVTGDDMVFNRIKQDVQKEDYEIVEEETIVETKDNDKDDVPFDPDPPKKNPPATAGKYGQGFSTAKHLARLALQKQQQKAKNK